MRDYVKCRRPGRINNKAANITTELQSMKEMNTIVMGTSERGLQLINPMKIMLKKMQVLEIEDEAKLDR
ncbi:unnamed protein product [Dibothriocephalus latus]|uniref:Uncharacterized protein n=1 Tax=Dibothriocephalus latus TaxID=60516 RepID=A0A3P7N8D5_DIBLA|nr:unnamed protein product [Dibothriocephalus latus]